MDFFSKIKSIFSNNKKTTETRQTPIEEPKPIEKPKVEENISKKPLYFQHLTKTRYKQVDKFPLTMETNGSWESFFSVKKENPKLIGFEKRSRRKFRLLYQDNHVLISHAASTIEIVKEEGISKIPLKETAFEKMNCVAANQHLILLEEKDNHVGFLNIDTKTGILYKFDWKPFNFSIGNHFFLIGTRETADGPGELYCFDLNGKLKWALEFNEKIAHMGEVSFIPYHLRVSSDSTNIYVSSMDRLYRLDTNGQLHTRIALSELRKKEIEEKHIQRISTILEVAPRIDKEVIQMIVAPAFLAGIELRTASPIAGFVHDPETDMVFILEHTGRLTAWDRNGNLKWFIPFKNRGRFIDWIEEQIVVSFNTGETFWLDRNGKFTYEAQLPKQAATVSSIPNQNKYLIVCEDHRLYELDKDTGKLTTGSEGHPGMALFTLFERNVFFDGTAYSQGYYWLAPENHKWQHFEAKTFKEKDRFNLNDEVAPEITSSKKFKKVYELKNKSQTVNWSNCLADVKNKRFYVVETEPKKPLEERLEISYIKERSKMSDDERIEESNSHYLVCYDFNGNELWRRHYYSPMWDLYLSPDGEYMITSIPTKSSIAYHPGHLVILNKEGEIIKQFPVKAHGFYLDCISDSLWSVHFRTEDPNDPYRHGTIQKKANGDWELSFVDRKPPENNPFGAGLHEVQLPHFQLKRMDKKKYLVTHGGKETELKVSAAIYEAYETKDQQLMLRIGNRIVAFYDLSLEKKVEIKEKDNIRSVTMGKNSFIVATKDEARGYSYAGKLVFRYTNIPKTFESNIYWIDEKKIYVWLSSNNNETMIASIKETGEVINSQSFVRRDQKVYLHLNECCFVVKEFNHIQVYKI